MSCIPRTIWRNDQTTDKILVGREIYLSVCSVGCQEQVTEFDFILTHQIDVQLVQIVGDEWLVGCRKIDAVQCQGISTVEADTRSNRLHILRSHLYAVHLQVVDGSVRNNDAVFCRPIGWCRLRLHKLQGLCDAYCLKSLNLCCQLVQDGQSGNIVLDK